MVESPQSEPANPKKPEVREEEDFVEYDDEEWTKEALEEALVPPIHQPMQLHIEEEIEYVSTPPIWRP